MNKFETELYELEMNFQRKVYSSGRWEISFSASNGYLENGNEEAMDFRYHVMKLLFNSLSEDMASDFLFEEVDQRFHIDIFEVIENSSALPGVKSTEEESQ